MKLATLDLKPAAGVLVRHPDGRELAAAGEIVPDIPYWRRRLADADVTQKKRS